MAVQMRYGDYIKGGWEIVKANLGASIVATLCIGLIPIAGLVVLINFLAGVKAAKHQGKPIAIGDLFNFENAVDKIVGPLIVGVGFMCCFVPGALMYFALPILADKPGTPFLSAVKGGLAFGKANLVPMILLVFILGLVGGLGSIACYVGMFITQPVALAAAFLAYEDHKAAVEAAAAEGGVQL